MDISIDIGAEGDFNRETAGLEKNHHVDLTELNRCNGNYDELGEMAERYGIKHNFTISGGDVPELVEDGRLSEVQEYLREEIWVTFRLTGAVTQHSENKLTLNPGDEIPFLHSLSSHRLNYVSIPVPVQQSL